ncbi:MAG: YhcN/YlaJ family sporulation lipoprotein [Clostridiales bacterium]|jgi:hypothetical protein|nr:YhcN/YlaJ family sporulation lipoprotein [Clostridiales bacterium]
MKKSIIIFASLVILCCQPSIASSASRGASYNIYDSQTIIYKNSRPYTVEDLGNIEKFILNNRSIGDREADIGNYVLKLNTIEASNVKIMGNTAVVTVKVSGGPSNRKLFDLKKDIEMLVKGIDGEIDHVSVIFRR